MIKDLIPEYTKVLPEATDDQLVWLYKVCLSQDKDKKDFQKLADKIQKERKKRGKITTISSKIVDPKPKTPNGANPDDY